MNGKVWMKKALALFCAGTLVCSMVACGNREGNKKQTEKASGNTQEEQKDPAEEKESEEGKKEGSGEASLPLAELPMPLSEEKVELSIWIDNWTTDLVATPDELPSYQEMEKRTNVHINWFYIASQEAKEKFGLMIASGEIPDIVRDINYYYPGGIEKSVEEGLFIDMNDLVENYMPNYKRMISENPDVEKAVKTDGGRFVNVYNLNGDDFGLKLEDDYVGLGLRQDWMDELGLECPVTLDDWHHVLTVFRDEKKCEAPLVLGPSGSLLQSGAFLTAFGFCRDFI